MTSIKKHFKQRLAEINDSAQELALLSTGLDLFGEMSRTAARVIDACQALKAQASELKKAEFRERIAGTDAILQLEDIVDTDAISALEDSLFSALDNHADSDIGRFTQQLLEKFDRRYTAMIENIQQLIALLEEE